MTAQRQNSLPAFLRLFQVTPWNGVDVLPGGLVESIRARTVVANDKVAFDGCPFVGLASYRSDQAQLFFGRQKETLDALACFGPRPGRAAVSWLEISGNSGSGKSSLMNAGLLPLVDQGWLWPRTGIGRWRRIGPMMPGARPVAMLAEQLARTFAAEMAEVRRLLEADDLGLADWLRGRKQDDTAFLLAIDQFEELFTFTDPAERGRFDRLLARALDDADCPLFVISTMRADFLDRLDELPQLVAVRYRVAEKWTLPPIAADGLREVIAGPARLAGLDASAVQEAMVAEAQDEPGALPLVENALFWLWEKRLPGQNKLSAQLFTDRGGLAGILSENADALIDSLKPHRGRALDLLFRLVNVDPEARRHTRRRMPYAEAVAVAGGGEAGRALLGRLAGERLLDGAPAHGPLRLITVTNEADGAAGPGTDGRQVNLIHETLICSKAPDAQGRRQPFWPSLWTYIEQHKDRAARRERLRLLAREWRERRGLARLVGLAGWQDVFGFRGLAAPDSVERRYLRWSNLTAAVQAMLLAAVIGLVGELIYWKAANEQPLEAVWTRWAYLLGQELPFPLLLPVPPDPSPERLSFQMGTAGGRDGEQPPHRVTFASPFAMAATEVTFAQYDAFARATGRTLPNDAGWGRHDEKGDRPVIYVDWSDARSYARWLGAMKGQQCRLPSEAEWEYACRAGTTTEYALPADKGSDDIAGKGLANCDGCGGKWDELDRTAPVADPAYKANAWGVYDMHGNVWEWVEDCWHGSYENAPSDGRARGDEDGGDCSSRGLRGRSWYNGPDGARCAFRAHFDPDRDDNVGFRVVCSSPSSGSDP